MRRCFRIRQNRLDRYSRVDQLLGGALRTCVMGVNCCFADAFQLFRGFYPTNKGMQWQNSFGTKSKSVKISKDTCIRRKEGFSVDIVMGRLFEHHGSPFPRFLLLPSTTTKFAQMSSGFGATLMTGRSQAEMNNGLWWITYKVVLWRNMEKRKDFECTNAIDYSMKPYRALFRAIVWDDH